MLSFTTLWIVMLNVNVRSAVSNSQAFDLCITILPNIHKITYLFVSNLVSRASISLGHHRQTTDSGKRTFSNLILELRFSNCACPWKYFKNGVAMTTKICPMTAILSAHFYVSKRTLTLPILCAEFERDRPWERDSIETFYMYKSI